MHHTGTWENFEDPKALRREKKKQPRMRQHGRSLKKHSLRPVLHIHKKLKK